MHISKRIARAAWRDLRLRLDGPADGKPGKERPSFSGACRGVNIPPATLMGKGDADQPVDGPKSLIKYEAKRYYRVESNSMGGDGLIGKVAGHAFRTRGERVPKAELNPTRRQV